MMRDFFLFRKWRAKLGGEEDSSPRSVREAGELRSKARAKELDKAETLGRVGKGGGSGAWAYFADALLDYEDNKRIERVGAPLPLFSTPGEVKSLLFQYDLN